MKISVLFKFFLLATFICWIGACKKNDTTMETKDDDADTRIWVKSAYDSLNYMNLGAPFNIQKAQFKKARLDQETDPLKKNNLYLDYAQELMKLGKPEQAIEIFNNVISFAGQNNIRLDSQVMRNLYSLIGISYMRQGETQNCVENHNHQSCFIPIADAGVHQLPYGSTNAIQMYEKILSVFPNDLESQYLLNIAYMTLGKYPDQMPAKFKIDPSWFQNKVKIKPWIDIAESLSLNRNGHAGGVVIDDFTNDGWLDIVVTSWSPYEALIFYVNDGQGGYSDQTKKYGLDGQMGSLNLNHTDFNNDGFLDLFIMRGGWLGKEGEIPNTLMMNTGKGYFKDVTKKAGLTKFAPTQASAWSDFNLDGHVDLIIANESMPDFQKGIDLYINQGDGTFALESEKYGLNQNEFFKGCVAVDVNNDRYPDVYFTSRINGNFLLINQGASGQSKFLPVQGGAIMRTPMQSFPCWNFDFDNDGLEDIFVSAFSNEGTPATHWMLSHMGKADPGFLPKLYHNKGNLAFEEVGVHTGLTEVAFSMGCNFGDINTDGFLDFYLATGNPQYQSLVPNKMYLNMDGKRFEDVSYSGGFANIQKGHGVGFGDLDHDGDEDLYVVIGGAYDGDGFYNCLFENPNESNHHWVVLNLKGRTANAAAIGARVMISVMENGKERFIHRTITSGSSFGGNSLALEIGLGKATSINKVIVQWPCKECQSQEFKGIQPDHAYILTQDALEPLQVTYAKVPFSTKPGGHDQHQHH